MSTPLSLRDKQFAYLVSQYGPGLSYADMLQRYLGNGNKSISDLMDTSYPGPGSITDDYYAFLGGSGSLSDKQNADATGGISTTIVNRITNPRPASIANWASNNAAMWANTFVVGEINVTVQAGATANIAASLSSLGITSGLVITLPLGIRFQRSFEIKVDSQATITKAGNYGGYEGGQTIPPNVWTKVIEYFLGEGIPRSPTIVMVIIPGVGTGMHVQVRKSFLAENPSGRELAYADGNSPGWVWDGAANASTSHGPAIYEYNPVTDGPLPVHAFWAGAQRLTNDVPMSTWPNSVGGGNYTNTAGTDQPLYKATDLNGQPALLFDGTDDVLTCDVSDVAQPFYLVVIGKSDKVYSTRHNIVGTISSANFGVGKDSGGQWFINMGTAFLNSVEMAGYNPFLLTFKANSTTSEIQYGTSTSTAGLTGTNPVGHLRLGAGGLTATPGSWWSGYLAFVGIYTSDPRLDPKWPKILEFARACGVAV